ncbi:MAG TPA: AMP-binding protein, partial [Phytomonospora sp.]
MRATQAQLGILTGQRLDPASPAYATAEIVELRGADVARLAGAIAATVARTEALHCRFEGDRQRIGAAPPGWSPSIVDLGAAADPWPALRSRIDADLAVPMDPATGPLFAHTLYLSGETVYWCQRVHHVALDGYGYVLFARAVAEHYNGGTATDFAPLADLVAADTAYQSGERRERDREYWTGVLADREPVRGLADGVAPPSYANIRVTVPVAGAAKSTLDDAGPAWPHVALAAVAAHTHRVTGSREVTLGLPVANRLGTPAARVPAMVMNIVPVPLTVDPAAELDALVAGVAARLRESRRHQHYRYEHLRRDLGLLGGDKRMWGPVVNIIPFTEDLRFGDAIAVTHAITAGPVDDLSVTMRGPGELVVEANPALYTPAELRAHAEGILERLSDKGTVGEWTELPGTPAPEVPPVLDRIRAHVEADPDRVAIVDGEGIGGEISYGALWKMAGMNADNLARKGVGDGDLVGLAWPRGHGAVSVMLAALRSNAAFLPLDADGPPERNRAILAEARPRFVVGGEPAGEPAPASDDEPAYVIYTSGSTGRPNGVRVGRAALDFFVSAALDRYGITARDRVLQFAPLHFDAAVEEVFTTLAAGATLVVRDDSALESLDAFCAFLASREITVLDLPTAYWHELAYALHTGTARLPACVRTVIIGGEAALPERVAQWFGAVGDGDLVGLAWPRGHGAVSVMLAALRSNAAFPPLDADGPPARNRAILAEARPRYVVGGELAGEPAPASDDEPAYVIYTSGSTGRPNGVRVGRAALDFFVSAALDRYGITARDRVLQFAPLHFDAAVEEVFTTLAAGATLVVRDDSALESLDAFCAFLATRAITVLDLPTAYWHELAYALHTGTARLPACVRTVIIGGEAALPERVAQWFGAVGDGVRLINTYGPTEATVVALAADLSEEDGRSEHVPIGRPLPGVVAVRGPGDELHLGGPGLA